MKTNRLIPAAFFAASSLLAGAGYAQAPNIDTSGVEQACVAPADRTRPLASLPAAQRLELIACANRYAAQQINAQAPMRVDDVTTLESVETAGTTVIYNQRVSVDADQVTAAMKATLDQTVRSNVCGNPQMRNTISYGGAYTYVWVDRAGRFLHRLNVRSC